MKTLVLICSLLAINCAGAFEGIVYGKKTENGVTTTFEFYVKDNRVVFVSNDGIGQYRLILDRSKQEMFLCMNHPAFEYPGYYHYTRENSPQKAKDHQQIHRSVENKLIDGVSCPGETIATDMGSCTIYFGSESIDLSGFSDYLDQPLFRLLDIAQHKTLPKEVIEERGANRSITLLWTEAKTLDASLFEVPAGYRPYTVHLQPAE